MVLKTRRATMPLAMKPVGYDWGKKKSHY